MNKKTILFIVGLLLAAAAGTFLPQMITGHVESAVEDVTYQFINIGMTTPETREQVKEILDYVVGVNRISIHPTADQLTITFDKDTMKPEWISKILESHGFTPKKFSELK